MIGQRLTGWLLGIFLLFLPLVSDAFPVSFQLGLCFFGQDFFSPEVQFQLIGVFLYVTLRRAAEKKAAKVEYLIPELF